MRYIGNKESLVKHIFDLIQQNELGDKNLVLFDACCGTGSVSNYLKNNFKLKINDNLLCALTYTKGRLVAGNCKFNELGFNPIEFFNNNENREDGFIYTNFAPEKSGRMYFSDFNARRIDYFRSTIELWKTTNEINSDEYAYLLCCLLESISKVANVAGVYGSYLKKWDPRALKKIRFITPPNENLFDTINNNVNLIGEYNNNIEDVIENVDCDVLYLDPPYTNNSFSIQYHLLETIIRNDNPVLNGKTGARKYCNISNSWSKKNEVEVVFERVIAKTKAKYVIFSYSNDGLMSKEFILNVLKRHCNADTIRVNEISYKIYKNARVNEKPKHFEYLFYAEKKAQNDVEYYCPLNYMGGKTNVISILKKHLPVANTFVDLMGGGFNVGININNSAHIIYNDINYIVADIIKMFRDTDTVTLLKFISSTIKKYNLEKNNKDSYLSLRNDYNNKYRNKSNSSLYLYVLILYGFQQQIRFNSAHEFNNPVGESGYNDCIKEKIISFSRRIKEIKVDFYSVDFEELLALANEDAIIYVDPPYLITLGSYNDGKRGFNGWNEHEERRLLYFLDQCRSKGSKIAISNLLDYKGLENKILKEWIIQNKAEVFNIPIRKREEVLLVL